MKKAILDVLGACRGFFGMNGEGLEMIYTLTLNPSLDYIIAVKGFGFGKVNRTEEELILPGGKGLNVSRVLGNLGSDSVALGFTAGFTGEEIERLMADSGVQADFIRLSAGMSRINVKVRAESELEGKDERETAVAGKDARNALMEGGIEERHTEETEINGMGPAIGGEALEALYGKLDELHDGDFLVMAGSIPASMPKTIYADVLERFSGRGINFVVDATGDALLKALPYHPFLIKPNHHELGELFGREVDGSIPEIETLAEKLQDMGARNVLVSMGGKGAVLVTEHKSCYYKEAPGGKVVNTVGSGDSMVAGFLYGFMEGGKLLEPASAASGDLDGIQAITYGGKADIPYIAALDWGVCTGSASAFSLELATREEVVALLTNGQK